jgi:hypothetical protein
MIFRAIFWVGLVALLIPREPDLGLGRPGPGPSPSGHLARLLGRNGACGTDAGCAGGLSWLYTFQDKAMRGLAAVKADIDANRKTRQQSII